MAEKPIIFSTEMVKAILDGRKTVTRRLAGLKEINIEPDRWEFSHILYNPPEAIFRDKYDNLEQRQAEMRGQKIKFVKIPYIEGDLLWVKETWGIFDTDSDEDIAIAYKADPTDSFVEWIADKSEYIATHKIKYGQWKSASFMPKWAARIWLEVLNVRPERLIWENITSEEAAKAGIEQWGTDANMRGKFMRLWDSLNAKRGYSLESNPWVGRYEFKRIKP